MIEANKNLRHSEWYWIRDGAPTRAKIDAVECQKMEDSADGGCFFEKLLLSTDVTRAKMKVAGSVFVRACVCVCFIASTHSISILSLFIVGALLRDSEEAWS